MRSKRKYNCIVRDVSPVLTRDLMALRLYRSCYITRCRLNGQIRHRGSIKESQLIFYCHYTFFFFLNIRDRLKQTVRGDASERAGKSSERPNSKRTTVCLTASERLNCSELQQIRVLGADVGPSWRWLRSSYGAG